MTLGKWMFPVDRLTNGVARALRGCHFVSLRWWAAGVRSSAGVKKQLEHECGWKPKSNQIWFVAGIRAKVLEEILMIQAHGHPPLKGNSIY